MGRGGSSASAGMQLRGADRRRPGAAQDRRGDRRARSHVHIAGWHLTPDFGLTRDGRARQLRVLLGEVAERRRRARAALGRSAGARLHAGARDRQGRAGRAHPGHTGPVRARPPRASDALPPREARDRRRSGRVRRRDRSHLARRRPLRYERASDARPTRLARLGEPHRRPGRRGCGRPFPRAVARRHRGADRGSRAINAGTPARSSCRSSERSRRRSTTFCRNGDFRILEAYTRALRSARRLVYLESQFLWSAQVVEILSAKLREPPAEDFRVVVLLPAKPNNGADSTRGQLAALIRADDGARTLPGVHPRRPHRTPDRPALRPLQDRDRRRRLDDGRFGQPQRALVLQRHRDERHHL